MYAYYISVNGELIEKIWYSEKKSIVYDISGYEVNTYEVNFFLRDKENQISIKTVRRRSHWSICDGILYSVALLSTDVNNLLEFGSGFGSKLLSKHCNVTSVEHNPKFVQMYPEVRYIFAEIIEYDSCPSPLRWYDIDRISPYLETGFDLILVDGPPSEIGREGLLLHLDRFHSIPLWIIDDVLREKDQNIADKICLKLGMIQYKFWNFSILSKVPIDNSIIGEIHKKSLEVLSNQSKEYVNRYY